MNLLSYENEMNVVCQWNVVYFECKRIDISVLLAIKHCDTSFLAGYVGDTPEPRQDELSPIKYLALIV